MIDAEVRMIGAAEQLLCSMVWERRDKLPRHAENAAIPRLTLVPIPFIFPLIGATYYAILSDMYTDNLGFVIGIQEAVTGLGYMVGPMLGAGLYSLGGFRLPFLILGFFPLAVCLMLPPLLRDAHNFDPSHNIPYTSPSIFGEDDDTSLSTSTLDADGKPTSSLSLQDPPLSARLGKKSSPYLSFPFIYVSLGTTLATCGFAFLEPVLSEHLMNTLHVST